MVKFLGFGHPCVLFAFYLWLQDCSTSLHISHSAQPKKKATQPPSPQENPPNHQALPLFPAVSVRTQLCSYHPTPLVISSFQSCASPFFWSSSSERTSLDLGRAGVLSCGFLRDSWGTPRAGSLSLAPPLTWGCVFAVVKETACPSEPS